MSDANFKACMSKMEGEVDDPGAFCNYACGKGYDFLKESVDVKAAVVSFEESQNGTKVNMVESIEIDNFISFVEGEGNEKDGFPITLVQEGQGNSAYYPKSAIKTAPEVFEGAKSFINHMSEAEKKDRPEGDLRTLAGFISDVRYQEDESSHTASAVGRIHFLETSAGREAKALREASLEYSKKYPGKELVGLSIRTGGTAKVGNINGKTVRIAESFVKVPGTSVDIVTLPARGGRFHSTPMLESIGKGATEMKIKTVDAEKFGLAEATVKSLREKLDEKVAKELDTLIEGIKGSFVESEVKEPEAIKAPATLAEAKTLWPAEVELLVESIKAEEQSKLAEKTQDFAALRKENDGLKSQIKLRESKDKAMVKISEAKLPNGAVSVRELLGMSEAEMDAVIAEKRLFVESITASVKGVPFIEGAGSGNVPAASKDAALKKVGLKQ